MAAVVPTQINPQAAAPDAEFSGGDGYSISIRRRISSSRNASSSQQSLRNSKSSPFSSLGKVHPTLQQYECHATDVRTLQSLIPTESSPLANWWKGDGNNASIIDPSDVQTWFPNDDGIAFYVPRRSRGTIMSSAAAPDSNNKGRQQQFATLTYRQLHDQIRACPAWQPQRPGRVHVDAYVQEEEDEEEGGGPLFVVAILLPPEMMAEMAVVLLSIMSAENEAAGRRRRVCAAPLDPHMAPNRVIEAMDQLRCSGLVSTDDVLRKLRFWEEREGSGGISRTYVSDPSKITQGKGVAPLTVLGRLHEVRLVNSTRADSAGAVEWTLFQKQSSNGADLVEWTMNECLDPPQCSESAPLQKEDHEGSHPVLLLRTSGTTSTPKIVPLTPHMLLYNALCMSTSLELTRADIDCNAMPLYHIGGIACALFTVLVSGSGVIMCGAFTDPDSFLDLLLSPDEKCVSPTWYYGVPTMHKSILLTAQARLRRMDQSDTFLPNKLRFIRSGAAHLRHELALDLSRTLNTDVIPTYSMTECMPVSSSLVPINSMRSSDIPLVIDTVGCSIGPSVKIIDENGVVLRHGEEAFGELALHGPGVITDYASATCEETHTKDGWLLTGDIGHMDRHGRIFLKGRTKEMIKRGGEQIWPNQIDAVVEKVKGVSCVVTFGVPNELWGEEVAVAVVLDPYVTEEGGVRKHEVESTMRKKILHACQSKLDDTAIPRQVIFVSADRLLKGPTGKYCRSKMASHLDVKAVDNGALSALEGLAAHTASLTRSLSEQLSSKRVVPSDALNGLRFITACFVVQMHIGLFPNVPWVKVQSFTLNMSIFFILGAFQLSCAVNDFINKKWASFVGVKIGAMHALFLVSQILALPSYLLFSCGGNNASCDTTFWVNTMVFWFFATLTGIIQGWPWGDSMSNAANTPTWFQTVFYVFLIMFPFLDRFFRSRRRAVQWCFLLVFGIIATSLVIVVFQYGGGMEVWMKLNFNIVSWFPVLVCSMLLGYIFRRVASSYQQQSSSQNNRSERRICGPKMWGYIADALSLVLLLFEVLVAVSDNCIYTRKETFLNMRPGEPLPEDAIKLGEYQTYVRACNVDYEEFADFIHSDPYDFINFGRWTTDLGTLIGNARLGTPLVLLWIFALAFGHGLTARIIGCRPMLALAPLAYPVYLLHAPVARIYWMATRGFDRQFWWPYLLLYPLPVAYWEFFIILILSAVLGAAIDFLLIPRLMPHTIKMGTCICTGLSRCFRCRRGREDETSSSETSTFSLVEKMVNGLTGIEVTRSTSLRDLGLDSLGATALLSTLRASVPAAEKLTLQDLSALNTVGDLVDFLDASDDTAPV